MIVPVNVAAMLQIWKPFSTEKFDSDWRTRRKRSNKTSRNFRFEKRGAAAAIATTKVNGERKQKAQFLKRLPFVPEELLL